MRIHSETLEKAHSARTAGHGHHHAAPRTLREDAVHCFGSELHLDSVHLAGIDIVGHDGNGGADEQLGALVDLQHASFDDHVCSTIN